MDSSFRLNTDIIRDYVIIWDSDGFTISNPDGNSIKLSEIGSVYWRKPFTSALYSDTSGEDYFFYSECRYMIREIYNVAKMRGAHSLVEEGAERKVGKLMQLLIAEDYFHVPAWRLISGSDFHSPDRTVVKSLSGEALDSEHVLYTTDISNKTLDSNYAWFTQDLVNKRADITVCYVDGEIFSFELPVSNPDNDWRTTLNSPETQDWQPVVLDPNYVEKIRSFMERCALRFGRIDFVSDGIDLWFLEVNPNGQWAWLDINDEYGLITSMLKAIQGHRIRK